MIPDVYDKDLQTLELTAEATLPDIRKAYLHLRELYSNESIALLPLAAEFTEIQRREILDEIETAYQRLTDYLDGQTRRAVSDGPDLPIAESTREINRGDRRYDGPTLKRIREEAGIDLEEIARVIRVPVHHLENIESEDYERLPPAVFTRGFVASLADYLGLDQGRVCEDFMKRRSASKGGGQYPRSRGRFPFGWNRRRR